MTADSKLPSAPLSDDNASHDEELNIEIVLHSPDEEPSEEWVDIEAAKAKMRAILKASKT